MHIFGCTEVAPQALCQARVHCILSVFIFHSVGINGHSGNNNMETKTRQQLQKHTRGPGNTDSSLTSSLPSARVDQLSLLPCTYLMHQKAQGKGSLQVKQGLVPMSPDCPPISHILSASSHFNSWDIWSRAAECAANILDHFWINPFPPVLFQGN